MVEDSAFNDFDSAPNISPIQFDDIENEFDTSLNTDHSILT